MHLSYWMEPNTDLNLKDSAGLNGAGIEEQWLNGQ